MNALALYGNPLMDAGLRTYIMKIHFVSLVLKNPPVDVEFDINDSIKFDMLIN